MHNVTAHEFRQTWRCEDWTPVLVLYWPMRAEQRQQEHYSQTV